VVSVTLSFAVEELGDVVGGVAVCPGYAVSVDVEGGGRSGVAEALGDGDDGDAVKPRYPPDTVDSTDGVALSTTDTRKSRDRDLQKGR
jgi:hypothetical protein